MVKVPETWVRDLTSNGALDLDHIQDLEDLLNKLDTNKDGSVDANELAKLFKCLGESLPGYKCREYLGQLNIKQEGRITLEQFLVLFARYQVEVGKDTSKNFSKYLAANNLLVKHAGHQEGVVHSYSEAEKTAFANWINQNFEGDPLVVKTNLVPIDPNTEDLFKKVKDGILLIKLINLNVPGTIDERVMNAQPKNEWQMRENHELALNSASSIGCSVVNMGAADMLAGTPHLVLGILWQIIKIGLTSSINLIQHPGLACLLDESAGETMKDLQNLSPEELLIRWVNYHLDNAGISRRIRNFSDDIKDSEAYIWLLHQITPRDFQSLMNKKGKAAGKKDLFHSPHEVLNEMNMLNRAKLTLEMADVINCKAFVTPRDIVDGNYKLNLAFVANLFNNYPALELVEKPNLDDFDSLQEETREETTFRNWMNSLGLTADGYSIPFINNLYADLADGLVILAIEDRIAPGVVEWKKISKPPIKLMINQRQNCMYAVQYAGGPRLKLKVTGIGGENLYDQGPDDQTLKLGLIWQLMRAYTSKILESLDSTNNLQRQKDIERMIIDFVNTTLENKGKQSSIKSFKDPSIADSLVIIDLIDAIKPNVVNYSFVNVSCGGDPDALLSNAKLAISWGRKIGSRIYALPLDITEVNPKMVMTVFACLMARGLQNK